ncbi:MAG: cytochrome c biogenesis protein CcdA, partial [Parvibaculaceae bacterium]
LLGLYSIGLGVPFLAAALFTTQLTTILRPMRRAGRILQTVAGVAMIAMGGAMMTGRISDFSFWLLDRFPAFGAMG